MTSLRATSERWQAPTSPLGKGVSNLRKMLSPPAAHIIPLVAASILHAALGFYFYDLPAWKMFRRVDRYTYELLDRNGASIDIRDYVQPRGYTFVRDVPISVAKWLAEECSGCTPLELELTNWRRGSPQVDRYLIIVTDKGRAVALNRKFSKDVGVK